MSDFFSYLQRGADAPSGAAAAGASAELQAYIQSGPLLSVCGLSVTPASMGKWTDAGRQLARQMKFDHENMDAVQKLRVYLYYLPIFFWAQAQVAAHKASGGKGALVLGISAPQGCGKTTIVEQLELLFAWAGARAASVSIDDFYLSYADQCATRDANPGDRLLAMRGNAGTHDLKLGAETVSALKGLTGTMQVPRYNKSAYSGKGDRADPSAWPSVSGPLDVVLFEGWMSGFKALDSDEAARSVDPDLVKVNACLRQYAGTWDALVDSWLVVRIGDPQWVYKWRLQAEEQMRASGKAGMSDAQIEDFVSRFMPAYQAYLPELYRAGPTTCKPSKTLVIEVDAQRSPVDKQPAPVA
ncbi:hypothetical protein FOA52_013693 [Chlamydomonas sp. UWO 241]|nr:hypothetical protein FOA52_013693 [Chlamydomonas sp. UWO 241]